jgi:hypothetical protein
MPAVEEGRAAARYPLDLRTHFLVEAQAAVWALPELLGALQEVTGCSTGEGDGVAISEAAEPPLTSRAGDSRCADVHDAPEYNEGCGPDPCVTRSRSPYGNAWDKDRDHGPIVPPHPSIEVLPQRHAVRLCDRRLRRASTWLTKWGAPALSYALRAMRFRRYRPTSSLTVRLCSSRLTAQCGHLSGILVIGCGP